MQEPNQDYITQLRKGIVEAICRVSAERQGATPASEPKTLYIGTAEVCETLTIVLAEFLEGVPDLETPADIRRMSDTIARKLRRGITEIRRVRAETGGKPPPSVTIRSN
ncbi:MAG: hypothetical protein J0H81_01735 [Sphingopyxis terrae]|nr:hypothetical protein [Sphingopyxis terrae]